MITKEDHFKITTQEDYVSAVYNSESNTLRLKIDEGMARDCPRLSFMNSNVSLTRQGAERVIKVLTDILKEIPNA